MYNTDIEYIGKIDKGKFEKAYSNLITDEVILTGKQRQHIIDRHNEIYGIVKDKFKEIIENPDYILKDNLRENTAMMIKSIKEKDKIVNLILKLAIEKDNYRNKNSIITCIPIGKNRLKSYINNGKIIYKSE